MLTDLSSRTGTDQQMQSNAQWAHMACSHLSCLSSGRSSPPPPHVFLGENEEMTKRRKASRASKIETDPLLSLRIHHCSVAVPFYLPMKSLASKLVLLLRHDKCEQAM